MVSFFRLLGSNGGKSRSANLSERLVKDTAAVVATTGQQLVILRIL